MPSGEDQTEPEQEAEQELQDFSPDKDSVGANNTVSVDVVSREEESKDASPQRCMALRAWCRTCCKPMRVEFNPLPPKPSCPQRFADAFRCPPHGKIGGFLLLVLLFGVTWATLIGVTGNEALPGGNLFSLLVLFLACWTGGYLISFAKLPPLLGMLLVGGLLNNVPHISIAKDIHPEWSSGCRSIALAVILTRAGLGLDPAALRRLSFVVLRLAFLPCLTETLVDGIAAYLLLGFPWGWGFMLGFVIAAVSPAVVVPSLLSLSERGYGLDKGVPTLVIAAASLDDVLAITGFGVMLSISFSSGNLVWTLFKGPLEAVVGIIFGIVYGAFIWFLPQKAAKHKLFSQGLLLVGGAMMALFGFKYLGWDGAGPLGALTLAFVAATRLRKDPASYARIESIVGVLWMLLQPLLFGLIGAAIDITKIQPNTIGLGVATLAIGLVFRMGMSFLAVLRTSLNLKERLFIPFAWLPKATVQAAIGAVAYDTAVQKGRDDLKDYGEQVLTLAVLSILLTAPVGAAIIAILGPRLLKKCPTGNAASVPPPQHDDENGDVQENLLEQEQGS